MKLYKSYPKQNTPRVKVWMKCFSSSKYSTGAREIRSSLLIKWKRGFCTCNYCGFRKSSDKIQESMKITKFCILYGITPHFTNQVQYWNAVSSKHASKEKQNLLVERNNSHCKQKRSVGRLGKRLKIWCNSAPFWISVRHGKPKAHKINLH